MENGWIKNGYEQIHKKSDQINNMGESPEIKKTGQMVIKEEFYQIVVT